mgnify:CR=1 FL=1
MQEGIVVEAQNAAGQLVRREINKSTELTGTPNFAGRELAKQYVLFNGTVGLGEGNDQLIAQQKFGLTNNASIINNLVNSSNVTCSFSSSLTIFETQYKCSIRENEFNFSQNPTITSGSTANSSSVGTFYTPAQEVYDFATGSYFAPYVTTIGLYNEQQQLLAVGKLAQPLPLSPTTDTTILINIDR